MSAGRRVELLKAFQSECDKYSSGTKVWACDLKPELSAACKATEFNFAVPPVTSQNYVPFLLDICNKYRIGLLIPTIDTELLKLAEDKDQFTHLGHPPIISDTSLIKACEDKRLTAELFLKMGIDTPKLFSRDHIEFPCFAKPYDGSSSVGTEVLRNPEQMTSVLQEDPKMIFMELVEVPYQEFTVDLYYDQNSQLQALVPRERLEVRSGEVSKGVTRRNHIVEYLKPKLSHLSGARGCLTLQIFAKADGSSFKAIEINPRFGGGYPLSYAAGANFPRWLLQEYLLEESPDFHDDWQADLLMLRYDAHVLVKGHES